MVAARTVGSALVLVHAEDAPQGFLTSFLLTAALSKAEAHGEFFPPLWSPGWEDQQWGLEVGFSDWGNVGLWLG